MKTTAAILTGIGKPIEICQLGVTGLRPGQVLVEIAYSGVCHTQLLEARGAKGPDPFLPHTLGHEGSGTVMDVGSGVSKVSKGDHVVLSWIAGAGATVGSTRYPSDNGPVNSGAISTFLQYAVTCESRVTPIPQDFPLREAALLGCAVLTGAGIIINTANVAPGASVAVFGVGGVGLSAILGAVLRGASQIFAVDISDEKLNQAKMLGATHLINALETDPAAELLAATNGGGVDCAVEAAGRAQAMESAFQSVRGKGGICVLAGNLPKGQKISIDPMDLIRGKRLIGSWGGESAPDRDIAAFVDLHQKGHLNLASLIAGEYPLEKINDAFAALERGAPGRPLISLPAA